MVQVHGISQKASLYVLFDSVKFLLSPTNQSGTLLTNFEPTFLFRRITIDLVAIK